MNISREHSNSNFAYHVFIHWSLLKALIQSLYDNHTKEKLSNESQKSEQNLS